MSFYSMHRSLLLKFDKFSVSKPSARVQLKQIFVSVESHNINDLSHGHDEVVFIYDNLFTISPTKRFVCGEASLHFSYLQL